MRRLLARRPGTVLRGFLAELALSTVIAPIWMLRRAGHVAAVLAGRDAGWQPSGIARARRDTPGRSAQVAGLVILLAVTLPQALLASGASAALSGAMVLPVVVPLLAAPWLLAWFDAPARPNAVAAYYEHQHKALSGRWRQWQGVGDSPTALGRWCYNLGTSGCPCQHA